MANRYRTIVIDPPWRYRKDGGGDPSRRRRWADDVYPTMSNAEIARLPIASMAEPNAHLYLWVTNPRLYGERGDDSITPHDMLKAWGFAYKTMLTWVKTQIGLGSYFRGQTEHVLFATNGALRIAPSDRKSNVITTGDEDLEGGAFFAPRGSGGHSSKPDAFYDLVQSVSPGPYVELFARQQRLGWETWGNEAFDTAGLNGATVYVDPQETDHG